jgi:poly(hydroxyalkanoate) depolymerase family esterase
MSLANNINFLRHLPKLSHGTQWFSASKDGANGRLLEVSGFGSNPGNLRMFSFVPDDLKNDSALVVVLHGCTQNAPGYDVGAGWSTLAERYGFALLMPEQVASNNTNCCFNWFNPEDTARGSGEACSIRQMIYRMLRDHRIDRRRIFVTGLSAGGAMTSVMLATYPDAFAGGAIIAGLPFGLATNMKEALRDMFRPPSHSAEVLGDLVRRASQHKGPWPKISVWHGSADRTVNPSNANAIIKQWLDVHQLSATPMSEATVDGYPRRIWWNAEGETVVESYTINNMFHGTPLGIGENDEQYGMKGAFLIEAGISSSYHIAKFFGLTERIHKPKEAETSVVDHPSIVVLPRRLTRPETADRPEHRNQARSRGIDVGAVITKALTAAGLMK